MNPLVDYVITEPCSTLTSPNGYTLTAEGERVLRCLAGGGAVVTLLAPEVLASIRSLGPAVGCGASPGGQTSGSNPSAPDNNPLGNILGGLLVK